MANLNNLKKLTKRALGLTSTSLNTEINALESRREKLGNLIFEQAQLVDGANVLYKKVNEYHLKNTGDDTRGLETELNSELESDTAIGAILTLGRSFFTDNKSNLESFKTYAAEYADYSLNLYIDTLLNSGDLTVEIVEGGVDYNYSDKTISGFNAAVTKYIETYQKTYKEYLPSFMSYQDDLNKKLDDFKSYSETFKGLLTISELLLEGDYFYDYNSLLKADKISITEEIKRLVSTSVLNLKKQVDISNGIIEAYGLPNLTKEETNLASLKGENDGIDDLISKYNEEKATIVETTAKSEKILSDLEASLASVDTSYISDNSLINIIPAASAHTEAIKVYAGKRLDTLIRDAASNGLFEIEVETLTDIEAKILLDNGYELKESTDVKAIYGNTKILKPTWTISWEAGNSVGG